MLNQHVGARREHDRHALAGATAFVNVIDRDPASRPLGSCSLAGLLEIGTLPRAARDNGSLPSEQPIVTTLPDYHEIGFIHALLQLAVRSVLSQITAASQNSPECAPVTVSCLSERTAILSPKNQTTA